MANPRLARRSMPLASARRTDRAFVKPHAGRMRIRRVSTTLEFSMLIDALRRSRPHRPSRHVGPALLVWLLLGCAASAHAETGYDLWLRYRKIENVALRDQYRRTI